MDKKETLANLRAAKSYLVQWKSHIQGFAWGMTVDPRYIPLIHTDGLYSKWFYTQAQGLKGLPSFDLIGPSIEACFDHFQKLYKVVKAEPKKAGLFGSQEKLDEQRKKEIELYADNVFACIKNLIDLTISLEKEASILSEEEFEKLI